MQVTGGVPLHRQDTGETLGGERVEDPVVEDGGGVHHGGQRQAIDDLGELGPVGDVAGEDVDPGAGRSQFFGQLRRARGVGSAPAEQDQVLGSSRGQPAGGPRAEAPGAAGDQDGATRTPALTLADGGAGDAAREQATGTQRELVLPDAAREGGGEQGRRAVVQFAGEVDQAAPALGVLLRDDPAESPHQCLLGGGSGVRGDRATGEAPQRGGQARVALGLDEGEGRGVAEDGGRMAGMRPFVDGESAEHAGDVRVPAQQRGQRPPFGRGAVDFLRDDGRAASGEGVGDGGEDRGGRRGGEQQPGSGGGGRGGGDGTPVDLVSPARDGGGLAAPAAQSGQGGDDVAERGGRIEVEDARERLDVVRGDRTPELVVGRIGRGQGGDGGLGPVVRALERIGGQVHPEAAGNDRRPVRRHTPDHGFTEREQHPPQPALVPFERTDRDDVVGQRHGEHRVR